MVFAGVSPFLFRAIIDSMRKLPAFAFLLLAAAPLCAKPAWQPVQVPILPKGAQLGALWSGLSGDLYILARTEKGTPPVPTTYVLHWDRTDWRADMALPGYEPAAIFGTDENNMFFAVNRTGPGPADDGGPPKGGRVFRSTDGGWTWVPQTLPKDAQGLTLGAMDGSFENVQVLVDRTSLLRFDGVAWSWAFKGRGGNAEGTMAFAFQGANEGYLVNGQGWGRWINGEWKFMPGEFGFCSANGLWGLRDRGGDLQLFAVDSHRFTNGLRVWRFNPLLERFDVQTGEESDDQWGAAVGIWGSAEDDVYVVGWIGNAEAEGSGRVFHYNGNYWTRDESMGPIPGPCGIHGTSRNDVWLTLADGRLLHYSTATTLTRKMSITPTPK